MVEAPKEEGGRNLHLSCLGRALRRCVHLRERTPTESGQPDDIVVKNLRQLERELVDVRGGRMGRTEDQPHG